MQFLLAAAVVPHGTIAQRSQSLLGLVAFTFLAFLIGRVRGARKIPWRVIIWGTILEIAFGAIVLFSPEVLAAVQYAIQRLLDFTLAGVRMIFGGALSDGAATVTDSSGKTIGIAQIGFIFAVQVLPTIIFIAMLTAMLYHIGIMTAVVHGLAWIMRATMRTSGAETLSTAANIFVGQTEAPLLVKPFLEAATNSELMAIMVGGFSNIASGVLVAYTNLLKDYVQNVGGHLALACFISAPATLVVSKLMMPETEQPVTSGGVKFKVERVDANLIDAATRGTTEGMALAINVGAMLITFTALVAMLNALVGWVCGWFGYPGVTMEQILGYVCAPAAWLCGVNWHDAHAVGSLLGVKTVLNEFIAYLQMSEAFRTDPNFLSPRSALLAVYALCGFANFASVGIQIGGISTMAPSRRADLSRIGLLAMLGGAIASCMGACVVGILT
ncbi:MAG TPA: nucleoside transporter C-terminal domain-containing protein [Tepidisphaeraceae bacterium]|nr:nucleoside transporter C-terminal domain-containing protein [Tepidisphaeraceae bacterium]